MCAGFIFNLTVGIAMKLRATDGESVAFFDCDRHCKDKTKTRTRGSRPPTAPYSFTGLKE